MPGFRRVGRDRAWWAARSSPLDIWQFYAHDVSGRALPTGHFVPEEAPDLVAAAFAEFLSWQLPRRQPPAFVKYQV
jgi:hypothetical protein